VCLGEFTPVDVPPNMDGVRGWTLAVRRVAEKELKDDCWRGRGRDARQDAESDRKDGVPVVAGGPASRIRRAQLYSDFQRSSIEILAWAESMTPLQQSAPQPWRAPLAAATAITPSLFVSTGDRVICSCRPAAGFDTCARTSTCS
jgi:hypothetical protein